MNQEKKMSVLMDGKEFIASLLAGGVAGVSTDLVLFPLDTIKTRQQSPKGFYKAGGFRGLYAGVCSVAVGSFPNAAAFFVTYEYVKFMLGNTPSSSLSPVKHMVAASFGEMGFGGLYRGYTSTVLREIPFSLVQFPLWEYLKVLWSRKQGYVVDSWQSAVCGGLAGGFAAAVTTPLDVAKTQIMLAKAGSTTAGGNVLVVLHKVWKAHGFSGLFAGVVPRIVWISLGGFIFLGAYDKCRSILL
nr:PREDICTED: S-adenosylmethionine mitochondrial carrier protein isoform X3 [Latimeria chalumnae]|eukprot:XP_014347511.1 PREDICTED: S-adenosylmethionine mitochondrial carrier protein isoform X3 [Latimeria chalumnae]